MEDQPLKRLRRLQNVPLFTTVEPPPPPQRRRLDTGGSFELVGVSEVPGEPKLRTNQDETTVVEIEELQTNEFARNFNPPLTDLNDPMIVQVLPFDSPLIGVPVSRVMASFREGISTPTSAILARGFPPPPVVNPRSSAHTAPLSLST